MFVVLATITASVNKIFVCQKSMMILLTIVFACVVICDSASLRNREQYSEKMYFPDDEGLVRYVVRPAALKSMNREADRKIFIEDLADDEDVDYDNPLIQMIPLSASNPEKCAKNYAQHKSDTSNRTMCYPIIKIEPGQKKARQNLRRKSTTPSPRKVFQQLLPLNL